MNLLSSLRYLVALHEHQHFGRAAAACHITQPALSNALRALEREFDAVIVRRSRSYAGLTPEGERVLATAYLMLHEAEVLKQELKAAPDLAQGTLRIAAVPTAMPIAARFAAQLRQRHSAICPSVVSMSSAMLEQGLEDLRIDLALGYAERMNPQSRLRAFPQYTEHYFLLRKAPPRAGRTAARAPGGLRFGPPMAWSEAARLPLCLLGSEMHNRSIVDAAFTTAGVAVQAAMETNSVLALILSVQAGDVCSILPGALVSAARHDPALEALPLVAPDVRTPISFMVHGAVRPSRALDAALVLAQEPLWLADAAAHSGSMNIG